MGAGQGFVRGDGRCVAWATAAVVGAATWGVPASHVEAATLPATSRKTAATSGASGRSAVPDERVTSRPDVVSTGVSARAQGIPVEAEDQRSEYSTSWVNPDGTVTVKESFGKVRFRDAKGDWVDVDLTLKPAADGTVSAAIPDGLRLASAGKDATGSTANTASTSCL